MTTASSPTTAGPTAASIDTTPPRPPRRAGQFVLGVLTALGRHPSIWDPWLFITPHRAAKRTFGVR